MMGKVLVIQGAGMNMRGIAQVETFGPMTLEEINEQIKGYAEGLGIDIELMHSNLEGEVINALYDAHDRGFDAALIIPAGYTTTTGPIKAAIAQVKFAWVLSMGLGSTGIGWPWKLLSRWPSGLVTPKATAFSENLVMDVVFNDQVVYKCPESFPFIDDFVLVLHRTDEGYLIGS